MVHKLPCGCSLDTNEHWNTKLLHMSVLSRWTLLSWCTQCRDWREGASMDCDSALFQHLKSLPENYYAAE